MARVAVQAPQEGRVGHDQQIGSIELPAHVDLLGNAGQYLLQGLVDGIDRDDTVDSRVDVNIQSRVAGQRE